MNHCLSYELSINPYYKTPIFVFFPKFFNFTNNPIWNNCKTKFVTTVLKVSIKGIHILHIETLLTWQNFKLNVKQKFQDYPTYALSTQLLSFTIIHHLLSYPLLLCKEDDHSINKNKHKQKQTQTKTKG